MPRLCAGKVIKDIFSPMQLLAELSKLSLKNVRARLVRNTTPTIKICLSKKFQLSNVLIREWENIHEVRQVWCLRSWDNSRASGKISHTQCFTSFLLICNKYGQAGYPWKDLQKYSWAELTKGWPKTMFGAQDLEKTPCQRQNYSHPVFYSPHPLLLEVILMARVYLGLARELCFFLLKLLHYSTFRN